MRVPAVCLLVGCTSTAPLAEFSNDVELHVAPPFATITLVAPAGCPELDQSTSLTLNGQQADLRHSSWGADCHPSFRFEIPSGGDATLALDGGGHRIDVVVPHAFDPRTIKSNATWIYTMPGQGVYAEYHGSAGDMPSPGAQLMTYSGNALVGPLVATMADPGSIMIGLPSDVPLGAFVIDVDAVVSLPVSSCTGATTCAADSTPRGTVQIYVYTP